MENTDFVKSKLQEILDTGVTTKFIHDVLRDIDETDYNSCPSCGSDEIVIDYYYETLDELHCNKCDDRFCQTKVLTSFVKYRC